MPSIHEKKMYAQKIVCLASIYVFFITPGLVWGDQVWHCNNCSMQFYIKLPLLPWLVHSYMYDQCLRFHLNFSGDKYRSLLSSPVRDYLTVHIFRGPVSLAEVIHQDNYLTKVHVRVRMVWLIWMGDSS